MARRADGVAPPTPNLVVGRGIRPVDRDLDVHIVHPGELSGPARVDGRPVRRELDPDSLLDAVGHEVVEVRADGRLAAADVDIEDLHRRQLVHDAHRLGGRQLRRVPLSRGGQAVDAGEVATVGQLPRQADRGIEPDFSCSERRPRRAGSDGTDEPRSEQRLERPAVGGCALRPGPPPSSAASTDCVLAEAGHQVGQTGGPQESEAAAPVVVSQGPEGLSPQGDPIVEAMRRGGVERMVRGHAQ